MSILDLIIFSVPGIMAYFWIGKIGITPSVQPSNLEQTALSAILWLPSFLGASFPMNWFHRSLPSLNTTSLSIYDLISLAWFLLFSIVSSFIVSLLWTFIGYHVFLWVVNMVRKPLKRGKLTRLTTVWENMFVTGDAMVVRIHKLGSTDKPMVGEIQHSPRPLSGEKSIILKEQEFWGKVLENGEIRVERTFINTDTGLLIEQLCSQDLKQVINANQELINLLLMTSTSRRQRGR